MTGEINGHYANLKLPTEPSVGPEHSFVCKWGLSCFKNNCLSGSVRMKFYCMSQARKMWNDLYSYAVLMPSAKYRTANGNVLNNSCQRETGTKA